MLRTAATGLDSIGRVVRLTLAAMCMSVCGQAVSADVFGLVIGIDDYKHLEPLNGAVNDAHDVSNALRSMAARDVRLLLDGDATREAIFRHWDELTRLAKTGDILVFHFAGHGGRQDAIIQDGHEAKDNMFLLPAFKETGEGVLQRIVDNEIGHMLAGENEATVVFVADSCFAGGMVRGVDGRMQFSTRVARTRLAGTDDAIAERVRALGEVDDGDLGHVIKVYGQDDNKVTLEMPIDGQIRGALSYVFSRALRGEADIDQNGSLDVRELKRFVNKGVMQLTERRQRPHVNAGSEGLSISLTRKVSEGPSSPEVPILRIHFADGRPSFDLDGVVEVQDARLADLRYSAQNHTLFYRTGDVVAEFDSRDSTQRRSKKLQGAVDKWRLLGLLDGLESSDDPKITLVDGNRVYLQREIVKFSIKSSVDRTSVLFNLAYDGTVQLLTDTKDLESGGAGTRLRAGQPLEFPARVQEPFGADHLVAITMAEASRDLIDAIVASHGKREGVFLAQELAGILRDGEFGVSRIGLFTRARGGGE